MTAPIKTCLLTIAGTSLLALAFVATPTQAGFVTPPTILTVGSTGNCDHNTIQAAITAAPAAGNTVIRISNNVAHTNLALTIVDKNIELRGGYPGCDLAPADPDERTTIRGNGGDSVIIIDAVGNERTVILRNLVIREGGSSDVLTEHGGGVRIQGLSQVEIRNSLIGDNESFSGGGIHVSGDARLLLDDGTIIGLASGLPGNRAVDQGISDARGGGITCNSAELEILDARVRGNNSESDGGGIYSSGCVITITPRPAFVEGDNGANGFVTFFENSAGRNGGAIYATDGLIYWYSAESGGHFAGRATGNTAGESGGAFFLRDTAMQFFAQWVRLEANHAVVSGGAVHAQEDARFNLGGTLGFQCNYTTCPAIVDSNFDSGNVNTDGGAVYADSGATINLAQTVIARNQGFTGSAVRLSDEGTRMTMSNVLVHQNFLTLANNSDAPISLDDGADADLIHVTMTGNVRPGGFLFQTPLSSVLVSDLATSANLINSIFSNDADSTVRVLNGASASGLCVLSHENLSVGGITVGDPDYRDPSATPPDFEPGPASDALDRCASADEFPMSPAPDLSGAPRPYDLSHIADDAGPWDMGALEAIFLTSAELFSDGFEEALP